LNKEWNVVLLGRTAAFHGYVASTCAENCQASSATRQIILLP